jgi:mannose-6-phosphate isomerase
VSQSCPDGRSLKAAIEEQPEAWLGRAHVERFSADTRLLVKLLDAGQRLPVHAHPHASFAAEHLGKAHGKAEAWYIVEGGEIYLGLKQDVAYSCSTVAVSFWPAGHLGRGESTHGFDERRDL